MNPRQTALSIPSCAARRRPTGRGIPRWSALAGRRSSEIWRVDLPGRSLCVKRALPKLKVAADWHAPVSRNAYEWRWLLFATRHEPDHVPVPLAHDASPPAFLRCNSCRPMIIRCGRSSSAWEVELRTATAIGTVLGHLHAASAGERGLVRAFDSYDNFFALRLEPYLLATAARHPALAESWRNWRNAPAEHPHRAGTRRCQPQNILVGPNGPVILDAECAWYGDPAFDLAFCLSHLLLKCLARPAHRDAYLDSFAALSEAYFTRRIGRRATRWKYAPRAFCPDYF